jgi:putative membrane protein
MMGGGWGMMGGWSWLWMLLMAIFWVLVIVGLVLLIRWLLTSFKPTKEGPETSRALEILKERYAKGEITKEQFQEMKKDLL